LTFILSTSFGRLYRLVLSATSGKSHLNIRAFARLAGSNSFSRLFPSFLYSGATASHGIKDRTKHIHAVALGLKSFTGDQDVWVLANEHIQHWNMKVEGWEELVVDCNLIALLSDEISKTFKLIDCRDLELSDLSVLKSVVVAISCTLVLY
jgi:nuclear pore complex protein Nup133